MKYSIKTFLMIVGFTCCVASCGRDESPMVNGGEGAQSPSPVLVDSAPVPEFESEIKETQDKVTSGEASQQVAEDLEPPVQQRWHCTTAKPIAGSSLAIQFTTLQISSRATREARLQCAFADAMQRPSFHEFMRAQRVLVSWLNSTELVG